MSFSQSTFATVGAQSSDTPTIYSYKSDDTLDTIRGIDYFVDKASQIESGDMIVTVGGDGSALLQVLTDKSTADNAEFVQNINNRVVINKAGDFPDAVAGVRTLGPLKEYFIGSDTVDVGTDRFEILANTVINGVSAASLITSATTAALYTGGDLSIFVVKDVLMDVPNGAVFDIKDTVTGTTNIVLTNTSTVNSASVGTFEDVFAVNFANNSFINTTQGLLLKGNNNIVSLRQLALITTSATFKGVDFGTSVSPTIEFDDYLAIGPGGAIGISGLAANGNVTAGTIASVGSSEFLGGLTPLENITPDDIRWNFLANSGISDTNPDALLSLTGNSTETVISSSSTDGSNAVLLAGTWVVERASHFTGTTAGRATSNGERMVALPVTIQVTIESASGTNKDMAVYLAVDGSIVAAARSKNRVGQNDPRTLSIPWQINFTENKFVEVFVENQTDTVNLIGTDAILRVR